MCIPYFCESNYKLGKVDSIRPLGKIGRHSQKTFTRRNFKQWEEIHMRFRRDSQAEILTTCPTGQICMISIEQFNFELSESGKYKGPKKCFHNSEFKNRIVVPVQFYPLGRSGQGRKRDVA